MFYLLNTILSHVMQMLVDKISRLKIDWNRRPLTEADFYRLCKKHKVTVDEMPLRVSGFYYCVKGRHFIAINSNMPCSQKLFVMFHEFAHFLFHVPDSGTTANFHGIERKTRKEVEADAFALCAIIPKSWIESGRIEDMVRDDEMPKEILKERLGLFENYGL
jgi:Zn-dependent peptidase ImmA (M78 family)